MNSNQKVLVSFLLGVTAGAVAGLLLAPDAGESTRRRIAEKANSFSSDLGTQITSVFNKATKIGQDAVSSATHAGQQAKNAGEHAVNEVKNRVQQHNG